MIHTIYGFGGFCADCDDSHNHPLHNVVKIEELPDEPITLERGN